MLSEMVCTVEYSVSTLTELSRAHVYHSNPAEGKPKIPCHSSHICHTATQDLSAFGVLKAKETRFDSLAK
jgi:hypothetical protein